jgi:hypothetical protein
MLTVVVMLSGPHRMAMIETALDSIPIDSPSISEVQIRSQGGPWDWAPALRERWEPHPKVKIVEFPDWVDFAASYNRTLDKVQTPWTMLLPDDDYLLKEPARVAFETVTADPKNEQYGFAAFGWYYLLNGRFRASYVKRRDLTGALFYLPKLASTLLNVRRIREIGGFDGKTGGFDDTVLFSQLAYKFDALIASNPIGVYRMHEGQESAKLNTVYAPFAAEVSALLGRYARNEREFKRFERGLYEFAPNGGRVGGIRARIQDLTFRLRTSAEPSQAVRSQPRFRKWSTPHLLPVGPL